MASRRVAIHGALAVMLSVTILRAEVKVTGVEGDVELIRKGAEDAAVSLAGGEVLAAEDRIVTGMDSAVSLAFGGDSVVVVRELTDVRIAEFLEGSAEVRTRLWLKAGQVSADLLHQSGARSDFAVKTPTATCSVRGSGGDILVTPNGTQMNVRHGTFAMNTPQGETVNGAGQQSHGEPDGEIQSDTERRTQDSSTPALPGGASEAESDALLENGGFLSNTGAGAPGDEGSIAGNDTLDSIEDVIEGTVFEELFGDELPDEPDPPGGGTATPLLFRLVAKTGDAFVDENGNSIGSTTFTQDAFDPNTPPAFDVDPGTGESTVVFKGKGTSGGQFPFGAQGIFYQKAGGQIKALAYTGMEIQDPGASTPDPSREVRFKDFNFTSLAVDGDDAIFAANVEFLMAQLPDGIGQGLYKGSDAGNLLSVADTRSGNLRGSFDQLVFTFGPEFAADGGDVVFVGAKETNTLQVGVEQGLYKGNGTSAPISIGPTTDMSAGTFASTHGPASFIAGPGGAAFRDLSYSSEITDERVAFVGHFTGGEGVFVHTIGQGMKSIAESSNISGSFGTSLTASDGAVVGAPQFFKDVAIEGNQLAFIAQKVMGSFYEGIYRVENVGSFTAGTPLDRAVVDTKFTFPGVTGDRIFTSFQNVALDNGMLVFTGTSAKVGGGEVSQGIYREQADGSFAPTLESAQPNGTPLGDIPGVPTGLPPADLIGATIDGQGIAGGGAAAVITVDAGVVVPVVGTGIVTTGGPNDGGGTSLAPTP